MPNSDVSRLLHASRPRLKIKMWSGNETKRDAGGRGGERGGGGGDMVA